MQFSLLADVFESSFATMLGFKLTHQCTDLYLFEILGSLMNFEEIILNVEV